MTTTWERLIRENRSGILQRWHTGVLDLFSDKIAPGTPIGEALADAMGMILDGFASGDDAAEGVRRVARILAVHPVPPSRSMSMFISLRTILLSLPASGSADPDVCRGRIDVIMLDAFESFMVHREKIYQLKVEETRSRMHMLQKRGRA